MKTTTTTTWHFKVDEDFWNIFVCQVNTGDGNTANTDRQTYASSRMSTIVSRTYMVELSLTDGIFLLLQLTHEHRDTDMQARVFQITKVSQTTLFFWYVLGL